MSIQFDPSAVLEAQPMHAINSTAYAVRLTVDISPDQPVVVVAKKNEADPIPSKLSTIISNINDETRGCKDATFTMSGAKNSLREDEKGGRYKV